MNDDWDDLEEDLRSFKPAALPPEIHDHIAARMERRSPQAVPNRYRWASAAVACVALVAALGTVQLTPELRFVHEVKAKPDTASPSIATYRNTRSIEELNELLDKHAESLLPGMDAASASFRAF